MNPTDSEAPDIKELNSLLPAFEFISPIASDSYRAVFLAKQKSLDRDVAIKLITGKASENPGFTKYFETTARAMAQLNHPNLIRVFDSGVVAGRPFFVMEFVPGKSLARSAGGIQVEFNQSLDLIEGICAGLSHAHQHGILHGSLNLTNVLLNKQAQPKIGNFGISDAIQTPQDLAGDASSSACFAPEIASRSAAPTISADVFSVGAILYELITGTPQKPDCPPPSTFAPCPAELDDIWRKATHPDPKRRFEDIASLANAITSLRSKKRPPLSPAKPAQAKPAQAKPAQAKPAPDSPPPTPADLPPEPPLKHHPGINWTLIRNLFIIAILLVAISLAWDNYKKEAARRELERQELAEKQAEEKRAREEESKRRAQERANAAANRNQATTPTIPNPEPEPDPTPETPAESLARLRLQLASGDRSEMPAGAIRRADCWYFLVPETLSWAEAAWFAEDHGAHLAIPNKDADLSWLVKNVAKEEPFWIGAARSGNLNWSLSNGSAWKPAKEPSGTGTYVGVDKHGFLRAASAAIRLPFIIQWHFDGPNPASIAAQLAATKSSLDTATPVFPPGTRAFGDRLLLHIARPMAWRDALDLAATSGGHLAVPASAAEASAIDELLRDVKAPNGIWLGAFIRDGKWLWITGEPWTATKWASSAVSDLPDSGLIALPGKGWDSRNLATPADGFVIEWSADRKGGGAAPGSPQPGKRDTSSLRSRASELLLAADKKRLEQLANNAKKYSWDLDSFLRGLNRSEQATWSPHVQRLKDSIINNRVLSAIPPSTGILLSKQMAEIAQYGARKQQEIETAFTTEAEQLRSAFLTKSREQLALARRDGDSSSIQALETDVTNASSLDSWLESFGIRTPALTPPPTAANSPAQDTKSPP